LKGNAIMKVEVNIDTMKKINKFVSICSKLDYKIDLIDGEGYCISAKSLMGAAATMDWTSVYAICEKDIYSYIKEFVVE
jgi:hypothetical protein